MVRKFKVKVKGEIYEVEVEEVREKNEIGGVSTTVATTTTVQAPEVTSTPETPRKPQSKKAITGGTEQVKAPMPGTILDVKVKVGDRVKAGDAVVVLEAMKMENDIMTSVDGEVKEVLVNSGATVNEGDILVVIG
ncbi:hypothetical protein BBF96_04270 [Anoxybacter fermentans]|uniref:Lipoyl-binding domain-containing protein n=1 Tax=Anoxybacter fermentans TaxID=1323375 RepID=A0A3Q9HPR9_9FIRM|nr:biotin/lipoyl-containing protein [Anoxybacter fermentans]AZR72672.1 hypothetical protein BBF96_04270 [Anoxybacter fermentans]